MRYIAFAYPKSGGSLEFRAKFIAKLQAIDALCNSSDGLVILGEARLAEEIARAIRLPVSKPLNPEACLSEISELINRIVADSIRQ